MVSICQNSWSLLRRSRLWLFLRLGWICDGTSWWMWNWTRIDMGHRMLFELESFSGKDNRIYIGSGIIWSLSLEFQLGVREFHFDFWPISRTSSNMFLSHQSCDSTTELLDPSDHPKHFVLRGSHAQPSAGIHTKVAQVVALSLGCPLDVIRVADTNSEALAMWSGVGWRIRAEHHDAT